MRIRRVHAVFFCILFVLIGCVGCVTAGKSDHPAGKSLVIYWGKDRDTKRDAFRIAAKAGADMVDLSKNRKAPNIADYDNIFIGSPIEEIPVALPQYLGETDFLDRYVMLFWTSRDGMLLPEPSVTQMVKGACIVSERLFVNTKQSKKKELNEAIDSWTDEMLKSVTPPSPVYREDNPAGRSLVLFWGDSRTNTRAAYEIAEASDAQLFDMAGGDDAPDVHDFDSFYIGIPLDDNSIPSPLKDFLSRIDFIDGYTALFWTGARQNSLLNPESAPFSPLLQGARIIAEQGFPSINSLPPQELKAAVHSMTDPLIARFTSIHGTGLRAEYMVKAFAYSYPDRITDVSFRDDDWALLMDDTWYYYAKLDP